MEQVRGVNRLVLLAWAAPLVAALSLVEGLLVLLNPEYYRFSSPQDFALVGVEAAALLASLAALAGLHARLGVSYGGLGRSAVLLAAAGTALAGVGHLVAVPFFDFINTGAFVYVFFAYWEGYLLPGGVAYVLGTVVMSAGYLLLGATLLRARATPWWSGPVLVAGMAALWTNGVLGWALFGLAWLLVRGVRGAVSPSEGPG